ncbi:histidyl-tRNA synthetase 1 [Corchorus capsularis]|uniref:histidine--tRNA ligase n=1 Tax=Corchorus capsularis TaxID=210143 RepID=A0A1R3K887_COCAP|nr:histidyl-tRNA synthetase 1 [Corchorus capsularis]
MDVIKKVLEPTGLADQPIKQLLQILGGAGEGIADLRRLFSLAEKFAYFQWIRFDAAVVRWLAYCTGVVFEEDIPACGFGFGNAVVVEVS